MNWIRNFVNGKTLAHRTQQRNHLIMRLRGALEFAKAVGMDENIIQNYRYRIYMVRKMQVDDKQKVRRERNAHS